MPLETIRAYDDHGEPDLRLTGKADDAAAKLGLLRELGIDLDDINRRLLSQGIDKFVKPYDSLIASVETARRKALAIPGVATERRAERGT